LTVVWHVDVRSGPPRVDGIRAAIDAVDAALHVHEIDVRQVTTRAEARRLARHLAARDRSGDEVLHLHSVFRPQHDMLAALAHSTGRPYVVSPHSALAPAALARQSVRKTTWLRLVDRALLEHASAVCCLSPREEAEVRTVAPRGVTALIRNPLPRPVIDEAPWMLAGASPGLLLSLSRWDVYQKGLDRLAAMAKAAPSLQVAVHGEQDRNGPDATERLRLAAPANFALSPPVFGPAKFDLLRSAAMYVVTSRWEGLSMSLLEALALGVPIAVSRYVAGTLPVAEEQLGLVLDDDPARAAAQLTQAVTDTDALERWSAAGRAWAWTHCSPPAVADALACVYGAAKPATSRMRRAGTPA
jgi:glycosyltransferase involved in cell wall biosynthesis